MNGSAIFFRPRLIYCTMVCELARYRAVMVVSIGFMAGMVVCILLENVFHAVYFVTTLITAAVFGVVAFKNIGKARGVIGEDIGAFSLFCLGVFLAAMWESIRIRVILLFDVPRYVLAAIVIFGCYRVLKGNWKKGG